jgi:hypothetical protein
MLTCRGLGGEAQHSFWSSAVDDSGWSSQSYRFNSEKWAGSYRTGGTVGNGVVLDFVAALPCRKCSMHSVYIKLSTAQAEIQFLSKHMVTQPVG